MVDMSARPPSQDSDRSPHFRLSLEALERRENPSSWYQDVGDFFSSVYNDVTHEVGSWFDSSRGKPETIPPAAPTGRPTFVYLPIAGKTISPQDDGWSCGANVAARFLNFYGVNISYETARWQATKVENAPFMNPGEWGQGTNPDALLDLLRKYKPDVRLEEETTFARLLEILASGKPVIALVKPSPKSDIMHYIVVQGYNEQTHEMYFTDTNGESYTTTYADFQRMWNWNVGWFLNCVYDSVGMDPRTIVY